MTKKLISVLLSAIFVLSCCSAAFVAFAESANAAETAAPAEITEEVTAPVAEEDSQEPKLDVDDSVEDLLEDYAALSEKQDVMTSEQKAKLEKVGKMISDFGKDFAGALTSDEAIAQYNEILTAMSDAAVKVFSSVTATGAVADFNAMVEAYEGKVSVAEPTEEDLKGYNDILAAYEKLTDEQKGQVDLFMFDKMFHLILDREKQVSIKNNPDIPSYNKQHTVNAQLAAEEILGNVGYAAAFAGAKELATVMSDSKKTLDEKMEAYKNATQYERAYADCWYASYSSFYYKLESYNLGKSFVTLAQAYGDEILAENPFTEVAPTVPEKPNKNDYPEGESDPAYIEAWNKYMAGSKAKAEYDCRKTIHEGACDIQGVKKVEAVAPEYAGLADFMSAAVAAVQAFDQDSSQIAPAKEVSKTYDEMSTFLQKFILNNTTIKVYCEPTEYSSYWSTSSKSTKDVYQQCVDIGQYDKLAAFEAVIKGIEEPYNNSDIIKAKDAYNNVPTGLRPFIPAEIMEKYKAILASIGPDDPSFDEPDLSVFKKTEVTYPKGVTPEQVEKALPRIESFLTDVLLPILGVDGGLPQLVKSGLYTNATICALCQFLYPMLADLGASQGGLVASLLTIKPTDLAKKLTEEKFAGAVDALNTVEDNDWKKLVFDNGDMGFQDGDKEGFLDAFAAVFRPLSIITAVLSFENTINTTNGTYTYNAYEDLVPIFEALDLEGYMSSHEYTLYVNEINAKDSNMVMDARIRPILVPIFNLIDQFAESPLDTLVTVLPKLGYALKTDLISTQIAALLGKMKLVSIDPPDLSAGALFDMIAPMLENLNIGGTTISIKLNKDNFLKFVDEVGGCGDAYVKNSKIRGLAYNLGIHPDKADAFVVLFRWLYGELTAPENIESIKTVVDASSLESVQKKLINAALSAISKMPADMALVALINLVAPSMPDIGGLVPDIDLPDFGGLIPGGDNNNNDGNDNGGTTQTDNPSIPKTGGQIITSLFALAAIAGLAGGAVLLKKKADADKD